ncbi:MAG: HAMP domain-containing protein [Candidatus Electrothrix sp. GM3_4]|nr:HAMP domain-containing protein [Candidatus Electrothrix sp. GM3_4]
MIPFYKMKWYIGTKIQKDLIIYIICMSLLSQLVVISHNLLRYNVMNESYAQYIIYIIQIAFFGSIVYGFWLSNRIAGPLFRLKKHLDEVAEGKINSEIQFRKNDYASEIAESFNIVVEKRFSKS